MSLSTDLSIFKDIQKLPKWDCKDYKSCIAIHRLLSALRYYSTLKLQSNKDHQEIFTSFINEIYKHPLLIQDFNHFQTRHSNHQLSDIIKYAKETGLTSACDIDSCDYSSRHYRVNIPSNTTKTSKMDPHLQLYANTMDSLHFYLSHLHDVGLRCLSQEEDDHDTDDNINNKNNESYDPEFARIGSIISSTRSSSDRFNRVSSGNKFNIEMDDAIQNEEDQIEIDDDESSVTYLDFLMEEIYWMDVNEDVITKLINYMKQEQFETESMDLDLQLRDGNIAKYMVNHEKCMNAVIEILNQSRGVVLLYGQIRFYIAHVCFLFCT